MKKIILFTITIVLTTTLLGCQSNQENEIDIIATQIPHAEILTFAKDLLKEDGYELNIITTSDYYFPNPSVAQGDADANYFQHIPFLNLYNDTNPDNQLVIAAGIHIEPIGLYANNIDDIDSIPDGATVLFSNSISDHGRVLNLLESAGLITLKEGIDITDADFDYQEAILNNPKNLVLKADVSPDFLISAYQSQEADLYVINSNYVLEGDMNPLTDSIFIEETDNNPYVNVLAVKAELLDSDQIKALIRVLQSEAVKNYILDTYQGAVIPA